MKKSYYFTLAAFSLSGVTVGYSAAFITIPHTFTAGSTIRASEVNENFSSISTSITNVINTQNSQASEILQIKNSPKLERSASYSEIVITPANLPKNATFDILGTHYKISEVTGIDPFTGISYKIRLPDLVDNFGSPPLQAIFSNCLSSMHPASSAGVVGNSSLLVLKKAMIGDIVGYLAASGGFRQQAGITNESLITYINIQVSDSVCAIISAGDTSNMANASELLSRSTELMKYISVDRL